MTGAFLMSHVRLGGNRPRRILTCMTTNSEVLTAAIEAIVREMVHDEIQSTLTAAFIGTQKAMSIDPRRLYSVAEVAGILGTGRGYVTNRIKAGELPVVELGETKPKQRVPLSALNAFIEKRTFDRAS